MARQRAATGTKDILPDRVGVFDHVFDTCRAVFERAGYREIRTPLFEDTALFVRSLGEVSEVVDKEMFTVQRGESSVTFRPEGTASVVRAYLEHHLDKSRAFQKLYYAGPMFRYERPQAGRERQFYQLGIEALGSASPLLDAEVLGIAHGSFAALGLENFKLHVNSIGGPDDRERYRGVLKEHMQAHLDERCEDCHRRYERNVFRMLDCKVKGCQPSNASAPTFLQHLTDASRARFDATLAGLDALGVPYEVDDGIVRGFDYYTHTVFEVHCSDLGARSAVCGGGRYDHLIAEMGGPDLGCTGFAIGVSATMLALEKQAHASMAPGAPDLPVFVAPVTDAERHAAFVLAHRLRAAGVEADTDYEDKSLKAMLKGANKRGTRLAVMLGPDEVAGGIVKVKDFKTSEEFTLADDAELGPALRTRLEA